jgi:hypothetical protein
MGGLRNMKVKGVVVTLGLFVLLGAVSAIVLLYYSAADNRAPVLTTDQVVGRWEGRNAGKLVIEPDGTVQAFNLPDALFGTTIGYPRSGEGRWELVAPIANPGGRKTELRLTFDRLDGFSSIFSMRVNARSKNNQLILYFFIGDPDLDKTYDLRKTS